MEGYLSKWTNYIRGWQQRWFVLKDGVLSYYNTQNDSINGDCKRSFKISMFDIIVNKGDNSRVDLILPNEQYLYLKASDYKERQKWLVALASQKAIYPMNSMPQVISGSSASSSAAAANDSESSGGAEHKLPNMTGIYDSTHLLKIKQSELRFYCDLLTQQTHEVKNLLLQVSPPASSSSAAAAANEDTLSLKQRTLSGESADTAHHVAIGGPAAAASASSSSTIVAPSFASLAVHSNNNTSTSDSMSGYISASSSFKSITPMSSTGHQSGSDSESAAAERSTLTTIPHVDLSSSPPNLPDDLIIGHSDSNTASAVTASDSNPNAPNEPSEPHRIVIIDEDFIKKLDDVSSNINMTCDMLMQIIRNLILVSNTSTNVGPEALKSLLAAASMDSTSSTSGHGGGGSPKTPKSASDSLKTDLEQYKYHLYHPMYLNNQLSQYNTKNLPVQPATSASTSSTAQQSHLYDHHHHHHSTK